MLTPRPYLSYSQMVKFEKSEAEYANEYIYGKKQYTNINMAYGSKMAGGLEAEESTGDPLLDLIMARLPKFELMDKPLEADLRNGNETIRLLAKMDSSKADYTAFKEYKTSVRKWTQKMADSSSQITFYATTIWLAKGFIPKDIELINAQVEYAENGSLRPTGDIWIFPTERTMIDVIKMTKRIKQTWAGIKALCERELL